MKHQLQLALDNQPAALERVLQTTRYRGFELEHLSLSKGEGDQLMVDMQVSSEQPLFKLTSQLNKLYDLCSLQTLEKMPQQLRAS